MRTPLERAAIRHVARTPEQRAAIQSAWDARKAQRTSQSTILERAIERHNARPSGYREDVLNRLESRNRLRLRFPDESEATIITALANDSKVIAKNSRNNLDWKIPGKTVTKMIKQGRSSVEIDAYIQSELNKARNEGILSYYRSHSLSTKSRTDSQIFDILWRFNEKHFTPEQIQGFYEFERSTGFIRGLRMTLEEADKQSANPNWAYREGYRINCATCSAAYTLREMGFDVTAKMNPERHGNIVYELSLGRSFEAWKNNDGTPSKQNTYYDWMNKNGLKRMNAKSYRTFFEEMTKEKGTYIITIGWEPKGGHATILRRDADGHLYYIEPQYFNGYVKRTLDQLCNDGVEIINNNIRGILRVDDKIFNTKDWATLFE